MISNYQVSKVSLFPTSFTIFMLKSITSAWVSFRLTPITRSAESWQQKLIQSKEQIGTRPFGLRVFSTGPMDGSHGSMGPKRRDESGNNWVTSKDVIFLILSCEKCLNWQWWSSMMWIFSFRTVLDSFAGRQAVLASLQPVRSTPKSRHKWQTGGCTTQLSQITSSPQNRSENKTSLKTPAATYFRLFWQQFHVILIQVTTAFWGSATCCVNCCHCELSGGWSWLGQLLPLQGPISHHLNENFEHVPSPAWHIQGSLHTGAVDELLVQQLVPGEVWSRRRNRFGGSNLKCQDTSSHPG